LACHFQKLSSMVCAQLTEEFSIKLWIICWKHVRDDETLSHNLRGCICHQKLLKHDQMIIFRWQHIILVLDIKNSMLRKHASISSTTSLQARRYYNHEQIIEDVNIRLGSCCIKSEYWRSISHFRFL
jgi:hypothetical protein